MNLAAAPGYALDLAGDPCIILRNPDGALVARFPHNIDPDELRRAAEEDRQQRGRDLLFTQVRGRGILGS
jgi:hypothetical protein